MVAPPRHVDHLVVPVVDLAEAAERFREAGYIVTPRADHPFGTSNRLIVFRQTYIELVAVTRPEKVPDAGFASEVAGFVAAGQGVSHVVVSSEDAATDYAALQGTGLALQPPFDFSRPAPRADGTTATASFSLVMSSSGSSVGAFLCAQHTKSAIWHPSHLEHPNGARSIRTISLAAVAPDLLGCLEVDGVIFEQPHSVVTTDGAGPRLQLGTLTVEALAAS